jgi:hypothetical protein
MFNSSNEVQDKKQKVKNQKSKNNSPTKTQTGRLSTLLTFAFSLLT